MKRIVLSVCAAVVAVCAADMMALEAFAASADAEGAVRYVKTASLVPAGRSLATVRSIWAAIRASTEGLAFSCRSGS